MEAPGLFERKFIRFALLFHFCKGESCQEDLDECKLGDPCLHKGVCINTIGSYSCQCLQGWNGQHCHTRTSQETQCMPGWMGDLCYDRCLNSTHCGINQNCRRHGRGMMCVCKDGWTGDNCTTEVNECAKNPCKDYEICKNTIGSYTCECLNGWNGTTCSVDIDECTRNPCKNSGICTNTDGSYYCNCTDGWFGSNCDQVKEPRFEDAVNAGCTSNGWNISLDVSVLMLRYPCITHNNIYFGPSKCKGEQNGTEIWFKQSFNDCMTSEKARSDLACSWKVVEMCMLSSTPYFISYQEVYGSQIFANYLFYAVFDPIDPTIVRHHYWSYNVTCNFGKGESTSTHLHHVLESYSTNITGHRDISITFFKDHTYQHQILGSPLGVHIGDKVFVKVSTSIRDWDTKLRLHTCTAVDSDHLHADHVLIRDGCEIDKSTHLISQSTHETKFVFLDFAYLTFNEGFDISCNATFCHSNDFAPECTQACRQGPQIIG